MTPADEGTTSREASVVVRARDLAKVYRLYSRPLYKFLDIFGLCPTGERYYREHVAVDGLDLEIKRGEKVAVIGRNGAGKSTLLKVITGALQPTRGTIEVHGKLSALLQIGTGFHPDFTGRENVLSNLAHMGITGADAQAKFEEAVDFAELEEYIDQPMKTYSTGMTARLMFAASTVIEPDILVCDEVLGVGDSYFAHKSYERMKELAERHGTTFILVTHDLYSALNVCTRFLWLERGKILRDADGKSTIAAYEHSIKEQEEARLHGQALSTIAGKPRIGGDGAPRGRRHLPLGWSVRLRAADVHTLDAPLHVGRLEAVFADGKRERLGLGVSDATARFRVLDSTSLHAGVERGRETLSLLPFGDIFHKLDAWLPDSEAPLAAIEIDWATESALPVQLSISRDHRAFHVLGTLRGPIAEGWRSETFAMPLEGLASLPRATQQFDRYGTGDATIEAVRVLSPSGDARRELHHGEGLRFEIDYRIKNPALDRTVLIAIGLHRHGYLSATCFAREDGTLRSDSGTLVVDIERVLLTSGDYNVAIGLFRPGAKKSQAYFTVSPEVLDMLPRATTFKVLDAPFFTDGFAFVHPVRWSEK